MTDPAIIEAAARALCVRITGGERSWGFENERKRYLEIARDALAAVTPLIEAAALERAARAADEFDDGGNGIIIAAVIRTLKEQPCST